MLHRLSYGVRIGRFTSHICPILIKAFQVFEVQICYTLNTATSYRDRYCSGQAQVIGPLQWLPEIIYPKQEQSTLKPYIRNRLEI